MITSPSMPKPVIEATVEFSWPTELDPRLDRVEDTAFSPSRIALARFGTRSSRQFDLRELSDDRSSQPFFVGAPFGEGSLIGFRFVDFGPYGQDFVRTDMGDEDFNGFIPLAGDFAGFGRFGTFRGEDGQAATAEARNGSSSSGGGSGIDLMSGAYNPLAYNFLYRQQLFGSDGGSDGLLSDGSLSGGSLSASASGGSQPFPFDGIFGPLGIGRIGVFPFTGPLYSKFDPLGPGIPTPLLGFPFGIFQPFIGPLGPFGFPFPNLPRPTCIPEPSQLALLFTLLPSLGLAYGVRCARRRNRGPAAK